MSSRRTLAPRTPIVVAAAVALPALWLLARPPSATEPVTTADRSGSTPRNRVTPAGRAARAQPGPIEARPLARAVGTAPQTAATSTGSGRLDRLGIAAVERTSDVTKSITGMVEKRLHQLEAHLGASEYLVGGRFTAADLMIVAVLRQLHTTDLVAKMPKLDAYMKRGIQRPAFKRALADQMRHFEANPPIAGS